jgi:hypothetical protein
MRRSRRSTGRQVQVEFGDSDYPGCRGKRRYPNWTAANSLARAQRDRSDHTVQPYHCPGCHGFHVGSVQQKRKAR